MYERRRLIIGNCIYKNEILNEEVHLIVILSPYFKASFNYS